MTRKRWSRHGRRLHLIGGVAALFLIADASLAQTSYRAIDLNRVERYGTAILAVGGGQASGFAIEGYRVARGTRYCRHALYWASVSLPPVRLNSSCSDVRGMNGSRQVGSASNGDDHPHAVVWNGAAQTARDMSAAGFEDSWANGIYDGELVGEGSGAATKGHLHAALWDLRTNRLIDLNGTGHLESAALATNGTQQVGWASDEHGEAAHAMLWSGIRHVATDLNPDRFDRSYAYGVDRGSQVGVGLTRELAHALLWHGRAATVVDLNPAGFVESYATAVNGNKQVGYGFRSDLSAHALVWSGKASGYTDLHKFLPESLSQSYATSIDSAGEIGGYATDANGMPHAVIWQPVGAGPLPAGKLASNGR